MIFGNYATPEGVQGFDEKEGDMKSADVKCSDCGSTGKLYGSDSQNTEGPWIVACRSCGKESRAWAYPSEAWKQWEIDNQKDD